MLRDRGWGRGGEGGRANGSGEKGLMRRRTEIN